MNSLLRKTTRRATYILVLFLAAGLYVGVATVFAVHDATPPPNLFELDGNAVDNPAGLPDDWDVVLLGTTGSQDTTTGLVVDPTGDDETTHFKGGDKDTQDIPAWDIVTQNDTPKDDIEHAFAAAYHKTNGNLIIYAGDDRFAQAGTASHGFWFFKNQITLNGSKFSGVHADGDTLVAVEFQQGGSVAVIRVFKWVTNPGPQQPNLQSVFSGTTNVTPGVPFCNAAVGTIPADSICGISNSATVASPWFYHSSSGDPSTDEDFPPQAFFELGIDITAVTGETCFSTFMATSRSSASDTSTIKDFSPPQTFPVCGVEVGKSCTGTPTVEGDSQLKTTFNVPITSTGTGTIKAVTLAEVPNPALGTGESCKITAMDDDGDGGDADANNTTFASLPLTFNGTNPVTVYDSLKGTANVTIQCVTTDRNPFTDKVAVTAKSSSSLTNPDLSDDHTTGAGETCALVGNADIIAKKCCKSVTIDPDTFTPKVCVSVQITNNSSPAEALENIKVVDNVLGTITTGDTLAKSGAGASKTFTGAALCYTPVGSDQSPGDPIDADDITFSDHLTEVSGTGSASGDTFSITTVPPLPSVTCNLCGDQPACDFTQ